MKSVTIRNKATGELVLKILHKKNGLVDSVITRELADKLDIEVRDDDNTKILWRWENKGVVA